MPFGSFGIGGGKSSGSSKSYVDPKQQPFLDFGRNAARGLLRGNRRGAQAFGQQAGRDLYGMGMQNLPQLTSNPFLSGLQQTAQGNPELVAQQKQQLGTDLTNMWNQQINPGIGRDYGGIGARYGSRMAVDQNLAGGEVMDAYSRGATELDTQAQNRQLQAGTAGGGLLAQGILGGSQAAQQYFDIGMGQFMGGFSPLMAYADIIGAPTVLDKSSSSSWNANARGGLGFS